MQVYAKWVTITNRHTNISFFGDSITTFANEIPENYNPYYPTPGSDVAAVTDTWWYQLTKKLNYTLLVNNSFSGTQVTNNITAPLTPDNKGACEARVRNLEKDGVEPDVVIIYMGTNDMTSKVSSESFEKAYKQMIDLIFKFYDDVKVYLVTMPRNKYGDDFIQSRLNLNQVIRNLGNEYNLEVFDLEDLFPEENYKDYLFAGAHPNKKGMSAMAEYIYNQLKD